LSFNITAAHFIARLCPIRGLSWCQKFNMSLQDNILGSERIAVPELDLLVIDQKQQGALSN
jgi:hypothetical protein